MKQNKLAVAIVAAVLATISFAAGPVLACPGCDPFQNSWGQDIRAADVAVLAELVEVPPEANGDGFPPGLGEELKPSKFRIVEVLKGGEHIKNLKTIETTYLGSAKVGSPFLLKAAVDSKEVLWSDNARRVFVEPDLKVWRTS